MRYDPAKTEVSFLGMTPSELQEVLLDMARILERETRSPAAGVVIEQSEAPEDDVDRMPGTWYFASVRGLPGGATMKLETKGLPIQKVTLADDDGVVLRAFREAISARAGALTWSEPAAFPEEWSRLRSETASAGLLQWLPSDTWAVTEELGGLRFGYVFTNPALKRFEYQPPTPRLAEPRFAIPLGPVPETPATSSDSASDVDAPRRAPAPGEILRAVIGGTPASPELVASGVGPALFCHSESMRKVRVETWASGPWRVRIARHEDPQRFQIAVQHAKGGDRALFASTEGPGSERRAVTAGAIAPTYDDAQSMTRRFIERCRA